MKNITISNGWFEEKEVKPKSKVVCQHPLNSYIGSDESGVSIFYCGFCGAIEKREGSTKNNWVMPEYFIKRGLNG